MEGITLDISEVRAQRDFHDLVARVLEFPHYYGRNLDAFWDCLTELDEHTHVRIKYLDSLDSTLQAAILPYIEIMLEYERQTGGTFSITIESSSPGADSRDPAAMPE